MKNLLLALLCGGLLNGTTPAATNDALLDLLVRKKLITAADADAVKAEMARESSESSAAKVKLSSAINELKLGGDMRLRYQYDVRDLQRPQGDDEKDFPNDSQRSRFRYRLRLNADFKLKNDWFGGVQLVTGQPSDSDMQTMQDGFSDWDIFISRAFLGWNAAKWLTLEAGKMPNPIYSTDLVWDPDINPAGFSQQIRFHELFAGDSPATSGLTKDGKSILAPKPEPLPWELTFIAGELVYDDNPESDFDNDASTDAYIFTAQLMGGYQFGGVKATWAPGAMFFNAADLSGFLNENDFSDAAGVSGESRKMTLLTAPGDVSFKLGRMPAKFYWDFAYNTQGQGRFDDIYNLVVRDSSGRFSHSLHEPEDDFAWLVGVQIGENKKARDWSLAIDYRQTGISSVDPNLNESDFALGELNTRGVRVKLFYNFTDFLNAGVSYSYAWNLRDDLFGGQATTGESIGDTNVVKVLQLDLNLRL
jgi:hypothetical protein